MYINLSQDMEQYLQTKVEAGFYSNASDVICDAIRRMWEEDNKLDALKTAIEVGDAQIHRGSGIPYTPDRLEILINRALTHACDGKKMNQDVLP